MLRELFSVGKCNFIEIEVLCKIVWIWLTFQFGEKSENFKMFWFRPKNWIETKSVVMEVGAWFSYQSIYCCSWPALNMEMEMMRIRKSIFYSSAFLSAHVPLLYVRSGNIAVLQLCRKPDITASPQRAQKVQNMVAEVAVLQAFTSLECAPALSMALYKYFHSCHTDRLMLSWLYSRVGDCLMGMT